MEFFLRWLSEFWWLPFLFFLFFGGGILAGGKYLVAQWQKGMRREKEIELKRDMIAKGFSPADIERVLHASASSRGDEADSSAAGLPNQPRQAPLAGGPGFDKARLVAALAEQGVEADGIERILHALAEYPDADLPAKVVAIESMVEQGMDAEEIERVIRAFQRQSPPTAPPQTGETELRG